MFRGPVTGGRIIGRSILRGLSRAAANGRVDLPTNQDLCKKPSPLIRLGFSFAEITVIIGGMKYGYARLSTDGQSVDAQVRRLTKVGCKKVFRESRAGRRLTAPSFAVRSTSLRRETC